MTSPVHIVDLLAARLETALGNEEVRVAQAGLEESIAVVAGEASLALVPSGSGYQVSRPAPDGAGVVLRGSAEALAAALVPVPPPGFQSITALRRGGHLTVEGDPVAFARALSLLEVLLEVVRGAPATAAVPIAPRDLSLVRGRYHRLRTLPEGEAEIFAERSGEGPPVMFLHTAGADGRQYHGLLSDVALAADWTMHVFDLPMHGRSMPPPSWNGGPYVLETRAYADWCIAFLEQVVTAPAVVAGCSMGAAMALLLAATRPDLVRGVVAVEAPFRATGRRNPYLAHASVNASQHNAAYVRGLMSPISPQGSRRRAAWIYAQGGPGVYAGDLAFYEEFDGSAVAPRIDAARTPVTLLTGAYDYSATPQDARRLGSLIPGAMVTIMPDLGHFPMVENPDLFRTYFAPALARFRRPVEP